MDEWMQLNSGEAAYRQQTQRAMRQTLRTPNQHRSAFRLRAALAAALIVLASRVAPAPATSPSPTSTPLAPAQN